MRFLMLNLFSFINKRVTPYNVGYLPVVDGHQIFYQEIGNPKGKVVLSFHGGPGGRANPQRADIFDLKKYRVVMFDQRGCGKTISKDILYKNTIHYTVLDAKKLLDYLGIKDKVIVHGCSFGTACALLFALQYKECVDGLVLLSVFLGNTKNVHLFDEVCTLFYPEVMPTLKKIASSEDIVDYFYQCAISNDIEKQKEALQYYGALEHQIGTTTCAFPLVAEINEVRLRSLRIYMHYLKYNMFLKEDELLEAAPTLSNMPVYLFHNRLDMVCPVVNAYTLSQKLVSARLNIIEDTGHISKKMFDFAAEKLTTFGVVENR